MPLEPLQERIIRTALALPHARTLALAGGCAVIAHGLVDHVTRDVYLFTERDADEAVELCAALRTALAEEGLRIESAAHPHTRIGSSPSSQRRGLRQPWRCSPTAAGPTADTAGARAGAPSGRLGGGQDSRVMGTC